MSYTEPPARNSRRGKKVVADDAPDLFSMMALPATPYPGVIATMGHSGTATSEERAMDEVATGEATERQLIALSALDSAGITGLTWKELDDVSFHHHGRTSSALTSLHQIGRIVRLAEIRNRCLVYVLPEYVDGREISPSSNVECFACGRSIKRVYGYCPHCGTSRGA